MCSFPLNALSWGARLVFGGQSPYISMNSPAEKKPSDHWKALAAELGFEWPEPEPPPAQEATAEAQEAANEPEEASTEVNDAADAAPAELSESPVAREIAARNFDELFEPLAEEGISAEDEISVEDEDDDLFAEDEEDALFSDRDWPEEAAIEEAAAAEAAEDVEALAPVDIAELEVSTPAAPQEDDRAHWRLVMDELGLELPPEPEPEPVAEQEEGALVSPAADVVVQPERFRSREPEVVEAELVDEDEGEQGAERLVAAQRTIDAPFGSGLFSEEEEQQFHREEPEVAAEPSVTEFEVLEAELIETFDEAPLALEEEEASPRKRGRRRTRRWKRLHTSVEVTEESELQPVDDELEAAAVGEEVEISDDLFGDVEPATREAAEEGEEESAPGEEQRRRRRRRRRRSRKGERPEESHASQESAETSDLDDEDFEEALDLEEDDLFGEQDADETEVAPRERPRRRVAARAEADMEDDEEGLSESRGDDRPVHRKIPTWEEAVSVVINLNMEFRARSPGGGRRRR